MYWPGVTGRQTLCIAKEKTTFKCFIIVWSILRAHGKKKRPLPQRMWSGKEAAALIAGAGERIRAPASSQPRAVEDEEALECLQACTAAATATAGHCPPPPPPYIYTGPHAEVPSSESLGEA